VSLALTFAHLPAEFRAEGMASRAAPSNNQGRAATGLLTPAACVCVLALHHNCYPWRPVAGLEVPWLAHSLCRAPPPRALWGLGSLQQGVASLHCVSLLCSWQVAAPLVCGTRRWVALLTQACGCAASGAVGLYMHATTHACRLQPTAAGTFALHSQHCRLLMGRAMHTCCVSLTGTNTGDMGPCMP
jgi:hypothetical protein